MYADKNTLQEENNLLEFFKFRYFPYWPLFAFLIILFLAGAFAYMQYVTPKYASSMDILIKDEKKGTDDSKMLESLNIFTSKKIVEDEMQVLQSLGLMKDIVKDLHLYAPVFEKVSSIKSISAYVTSPVIAEVENYDSLFNDNKKNFLENIYFRYDLDSNEVIIGNRKYSLNKWYAWSCGNLRFIPNRRFTHGATHELYFSLFNPRMVSTALSKTVDINESSKLSSVVTLSILDEVPQRGEDILNDLARVYNVAGIYDKNQLASNTLEFVDDRLRHVKHELDSIEFRIALYKSKNDVIDLSAQSSTVLKNVGDNNQKVADVNMQIALLDEVDKYVNEKNKMAIVPSTLGITDQGLTQLLQRLYDAEMNYEKQKKIIGENNPMVTSLSNEIEKIRPAILENIRIQKIALQASLQNLNSTNDTYTALLQTVPKKERGLLEITREETILNNVYAFLLQKREEVALSYASTVPDSRIVDVAYSTIDPVSPKKIIIFSAAFFIALVTGILIITLKDFINNKILFRKDIETLTDYDVIGEISNFKKSRHIFIINEKQQALAAEEFRHLRTAMGLTGMHIGRKKLLVTSAVSGEGKSFIVANLALNLASAGKKVVLLDFDLRNPEISTVLDVANDYGITDFLEGEKEPYEIIKHTFCDNLFVCGAGTNAGSVREISFNSKLGELFKYLEEAFDFIIIDSPPVRSVSDAYVLTQYCDMTLYVARHNYTSKISIKALEENNKIKPLKNFLLVFNGVKPRGLFKRRYGIEYGYGYEDYGKQKTSRKRKRTEVLIKT